MVNDKWLNYGKINVSVSSGSFLIWFLEACVYLDCMDIFILACAQPKITRIDCRQKYLAHNSWLGSSNQKVESAGWVLDNTKKSIIAWKMTNFKYINMLAHIELYVSNQKNKWRLLFFIGISLRINCYLKRFTSGRNGLSSNICRNKSFYTLGQVSIQFSILMRYFLRGQFSSIFFVYSLSTSSR